MPEFELEQVDGEGEEGERGEGKLIDLPHGDSMIGRGPFLGVSDKRVSRNHGILENLDGQLRLKPVGGIFISNLNPYVNSQGFEEEEKEHVEVVMETVSETEQNLGSSRSCEETLAYTPQAKNSFTYESEMRDESHTAGPATFSQVGADSRSSCKLDSAAPLMPRKKRILPAWMMDVAPINTSSPKVKRAPARGARNTPSSKPSGAKRPRARMPSSSDDMEEEKVNEEDEEDGCRKTQRKRARRLESDPEESQDQVPVSRASQERLQEDEDTNTESIAQKTDVKEKESQNYEADQRSKKTEGSTSRPESSGNTRTSVQQKAKIQHRMPCPYGSSCYRKNPIHFQECSHPGDDDYEEEQNNRDDEEDDRPECPYGTDCYRKNPLHKKEYKHTKPPAKKTVPLNDDDEDEDQYENSFINDDSEEEDVDEDSDYVPESEDSGNEFIKQLMKEAKGFLKKKK
ncbi:aprataxin and PNK-like factor isoform X2 [Silurus meridionalis]|nr:aprataxin and PNK-like factor isoform X2 [Silurus meridionalis]